MNISKLNREDRNNFLVDFLEKNYPKIHNIILDEVQRELDKINYSLVSFDIWKENKSDKDWIYDVNISDWDSCYAYEAKEFSNFKELHDYFVKKYSEGKFNVVTSSRHCLFVVNERIEDDSVKQEIKDKFQKLISDSENRNIKNTIENKLKQENKPKQSIFGIINDVLPIPKKSKGLGL